AERGARRFRARRPRRHDLHARAHRFRRPAARRARLQRQGQRPLQGRRDRSPPRHPGAAPPRPADRDQPLALHGREDAGAERSLRDLEIRSRPPRRRAGEHHRRGACSGVTSLSDRIELVPYDPRWPALFAAEAPLVRVALGDQVLAIEHFGSTAIPGMAAKPIIDILVAVRSLAAMDHAEAALTPLGYVFWRDNPKRDRMFFVKGMPPYGA